MAEQVGKRICGNGKGAGADGDMWIADVDDVEEERHSEDRTTPANQSEREPTAPPESTASASCSQERATAAAFAIERLQPS